jgi:hypothetical protein
MRCVAITALLLLASSWEAAVAAENCRRTCFSENNNCIVALDAGRRPNDDRAYAAQRQRCQQIFNRCTQFCAANPGKIFYDSN